MSLCKVHSKFCFSALLVVMLLSVFGENGLFAKSLIAKKDDAKVLGAPKRGAEVIKTLKKGERVESLKRKGMYWEVELDGDKKGFISILAVKPAPSKSTLTDVIRSTVQQTRSDNDSSNMRSRSTVMGVRGLDESDETQFAGNVKPNLRMVHNLEDFQVKQSQVDKIGDLISQEIEQKLNKSQ